MCVDGQVQVYASVQSALCQNPTVVQNEYLLTITCCFGVCMYNFEVFFCSNKCISILLIAPLDSVGGVNFISKRTCISILLTTPLDSVGGVNLISKHYKLLRVTEEICSEKSNWLNDKNMNVMQSNTVMCFLSCSEPMFVEVLTDLFSKNESAL